MRDKILVIHFVSLLKFTVFQSERKRKIIFYSFFILLIVKAFLLMNLKLFLIFYEEFNFQK